MKKRVAIVLHGLGTSGIDKVFYDLSSQWDYEKFDITYLLAVDEGAHQFWEDDVTANGVRVIHLHDLDKKRLLKWPGTLKKALIQYGPFDAVHVNMESLNGLNLMAAKRAGISVRVCHSHTSSTNNADSKKKQVYIALVRYLIRHYATNCVACSDKAGEFFFPKCNYDIVFNGIDSELYQRSTSQMCGERHMFASVGRISSQKNPLFLLEVFYEITNRLPDAKLKWVGTGAMLKQVKVKAEEYGILDRIEFMGARSDVNEILKSADYFLFPSLFEGFGLALVEAQAAELDCFASDTVPRIADCGKCMFLPLEKNAAEWADEIVGYIHGTEKMQLNPELLAQFDIEQMARKLEKLYSR